MAVAAQRTAGENDARDAYKATENRLYAYPVIKLKIESDRERAQEIMRDGAPARSNSIVRFQRSGIRLDGEQIAEVLVSDINAQIAANECERETIEKALSIVKSDPYSDIIRHKYFDGMKDDEIAETMHCDPSTVRRNKSRIVKRLAVFLYGARAVV